MSVSGECGIVGTGSSDGFFFFSSRRRHTRFKCDWSSDVCSSDLKFQARLARLGWLTVRDVVGHELSTLTARLGAREGTWLYERARGIDRTAVEPQREVKSLSRDETFPADLDDDAALATRLLPLADRATADLRDAGRCARTVTVKLRDADFRTRQAGRTLAEPVQSDRAVYAVARARLPQLPVARPGPARFSGASLSPRSAPAATAHLPLAEAAAGRPRRPPGRAVG